MLKEVGTCISLCHVMNDSHVTQFYLLGVFLVQSLDAVLNEMASRAYAFFVR